MSIRFDDFELDLETAELRRCGHAIALPPQPARLLVMLVEGRGRLIDRHELRARLWGESFLDWESSLHQAVRKIRVTLGDSAGAPRYIETVPRRGYRFIGRIAEHPQTDPHVAPELKAEGGELRPEPERAAPPIEPAPTSVRRRLPALSAALLALIVGLFTVPGDQEPRPATGEARRLYEEGLYLMQQRQGSQAKKRLEQAAALEPSWSAPWSALAEIELASPRPDRTERARAHLERALSRDSEDLGAWRQLIRLRLWQEWDWIGARAALEQALARNRRDAKLWQLAAALETVEGHESQALRAARRALEIDPISTGLRVDLGWTLYYFDHASEALIECERSLELEPRNPSALQCAVQSALRLGRESHAAELITALPSSGPQDGEVSARARLESYFGQQLERLEGRSSDRHCATRATAAVPHMVLGQDREALQALLDGLEGEKGWEVPYARLDPLLQPLHDRPEFSRLERALGLPSTASRGEDSG